jgi:uncharacterized membrane protein (UPF0127 family)
MKPLPSRILVRNAAHYGLLLVSLISCGRREEAAQDEPSSHVRFDTVQVEFQTASDTFRLPMEMADSDEEHAYGLMDRSSLAPEAGMLFVYGSTQDSTSGFWMFRTRIPLDIAFLDSAGVVVSVMSMQPCELLDPAWCTRYSPGVPYMSALEANRGFFARHGVTPGARVVRVP